jgi:hypothetical protein
MPPTFATRWELSVCVVGGSHKVLRRVERKSYWATNLSCISICFTGDIKSYMFK